MSHVTLEDYPRHWTKCEDNGTSKISTSKLEKTGSAA